MVFPANKTPSGQHTTYYLHGHIEQIRNGGIDRLSHQAWKRDENEVASKVLIFWVLEDLGAHGIGPHCKSWQAFSSIKEKKISLRSCWPIFLLTALSAQILIGSVWVGYWYGPRVMRYSCNTIMQTSLFGSEESSTHLVPFLYWLAWFKN